MQERRPRLLLTRRRVIDFLRCASCGCR